MLVQALVSVALAADLQALTDAEWARAEPDVLVAATPDDPAARAVLARALGRLRDPDALPALLALKGDPDPGVRRAVAEALGWTPEAAPAIREWLDALPVEEAAGKPRLPAIPGERPALLASLGFHADPADVPRLRAALAEGPASASAAAISLGRLGRAQVPEAKAAVPDLIGALGRFDPTVAEASAFALFRIGLSDASEEEIAAIEAAWKRLPTGSTRAWAVRATWPWLTPEQRTVRLDAALKDSSTVVRIAALDALGPGEVDPKGLGRLLGDKRSGVRSAALSALGRVGGDGAIAILRGRLASDDTWEAAAAVTALAGLGVPPDEALLDPSVAEPIRAAVAETIADPARLEALALGDPQPAVRSAAMGALFEHEPVDPERVRRLLAASDPVIAEGAIELAKELDEVVAASLIGDRVTPVGRGAPFGVSGDLDEARRVRGAEIRTAKGTFRLELYPDVAPLAVASFAALAERDFFVGVPFHRIVPGFVVQGGDPRGDGWGGPGYALPDEVSALPYDAGALGMARSDRDTGGSQWFVTITNQPHLVGDYTLFGHVTSGMQVIDALERGDRILDVEIERVP